MKQRNLHFYCTNSGHSKNNEESFNDQFNTSSNNSEYEKDDSEIDNHPSQCQNSSTSCLSKKKKSLSESDIPNDLKDLYFKVCRLLRHINNHEIKEYEMHCKEVLKEEKKSKRWKLECTLCNKQYRKIDYFLLHRGNGCKFYVTSQNLLNFASLQLEPILTPREELLQKLAIVSASCNISSRQIASTEF